MYSLHHASVFLCLIFRAFAFCVLCLFLMAASFVANKGEYTVHTVHLASTVFAASCHSNPEYVCLKSRVLYKVTGPSKQISPLF